MIKVDDLQPGQVYTVHNQGTNITPISLKVTIHWVGPDAVHYVMGDKTKIEETSIERIKETSVERFLDILNQQSLKLS